MRPLVFIALVGSFSLMWMAHTDPDVVVAQNLLCSLKQDSVDHGLGDAELLGDALHGDASDAIGVDGLDALMLLAGITATSPTSAQALAVELRGSEVRGSHPKRKRSSPRQKTL